MNATPGWKTIIIYENRTNGIRYAVEYPGRLSYAKVRQMCRLSKFMKFVACAYQEIPG